MNNKYRKAMSGVHHSDELTDRLMNIDEQKKRPSLNNRAVLMLVAVVLVLSMTTTVFAFTNDEFSLLPTTSAVFEEKSTTEEIETQGNTSKLQASSEPVKKEEKKLFALDFEADLGVLALASNYKYTVVASMADEQVKLRIYNHIKNKLRAELALDDCNDARAYRLELDDDGDVRFTVWKNDDSTAVFTYDKRLNPLTGEATQPSEQSNDFEVVDDEEIGTVYSFNGEYYFTPYHKDFQIVDRVGHSFALAQRDGDSLVIRIKNFKLKKQLGRIKITPSISFDEIKEHYFDNERFSFVIGSGSEQKIYVWNYENKSPEVDVRVEELSEEDLSEATEKGIEAFNGFFDFDITLDIASPIEKFVVGKKLELYSTQIQPMQEGEPTKEIIIGDYDFDCVIAEDYIKINAQSLSRSLLDEAIHSELKSEEPLEEGESEL